MEVTQIYSIVNSITQEILGDSAVVNEDLSNIVDIGGEIESAKAIDNYVKSLIDRIGKVVFVNRPYRGSAPSVMMDSWEYGSILEKINMDSFPEAQENDSWNLVSGQSYDPNVFTAPSVSAKFFNSLNTFEIQMSFAERQVKSAFTSASQLNSFFSMIETGIENSMTVKLDGLIMSTIRNMIAQTLYDLSSTGAYTSGNNRAVNLLEIYNDKYTDSTLTAATCYYDPDFIRFCAYYMGIYTSRIGKLSTLFNVGGKERFTPKDRLHLIMLDEFARGADVYLQSDVYHNDLTKLPKAETVPYWQGSGTDYAWDSTSSINTTIQVDSSTTATVATTGIIGVMFDRDALGVTNKNRRVTSYYNPKGEFYNNWYKFDAGYFNDLNENFIVFYVA